MRMRQADKVREIRLRRSAWRQGYQLERSRARDPRDITFGRYQLRSLKTNQIEFGGVGNLGRGYAASIDEVESWLNRPAKIRPSRKRQGARS
jgi:hypothetical protein